MDTETLPAIRVDAPSRSTLIDNVDVKIETVLGEATLSVAELNALTPGAVIPLTTALSDPVEIRLNGVVIAHGELVAVGDQFGVRLTSVSP